MFPSCKNYRSLAVTEVSLKIYFLEKNTLYTNESAEVRLHVKYLCTCAEHLFCLFSYLSFTFHTEEAHSCWNVHTEQSFIIDYSTVIARVILTGVGDSAGWCDLAELCEPTIHKSYIEIPIQRQGQTQERRQTLRCMCVWPLRTNKPKLPL